MGRNTEEVVERVNFDVTGELAEWMQDVRRRGLFASNPEIVRLALTNLRHHYICIGVPVEQGKNES